jgi:putative ABC transport system permease protein
MESFIQDLRYAVRTLLAKPGFTLVATMTLALGIGANTAIFSVVNGVLLKPLPYREPDRLVQFWETNPAKGWTQANVAPANYFDWQDQSTSFEEMAAYMGSDTKAEGLSDLQLTGDGEPERIKGLYVTGNIFSVLGAQPAMGRTLVEEETWLGKHRVVVISSGLWKRRFGSDPNIVGKTISLNGRDLEIVGVMPEGFYLPSADVELWLPMGWERPQMAMLRRPHFLRAIGRLNAGVTIAQAQEEMNGIAGRLEERYPQINRQMGVGVGPLHEWLVGDTRPALLTFLAAVGFVLLIACANVANLMLVRAAGRSREIAIRAALGAGRRRIVRQLLIESLLLGVVGGGFGLLVALWGKSLLLAINPGNIPRLDQVGLDAKVMTFTAAITVLTSIAFGLVPALQSSRLDLISTLKSGGEKGAVGPHRGRSGNALVVAEIALSFVLVIGAGLMLKSFVRLQQVDPGFQRDHLLTMNLSLPGVRYGDDQKVTAFYERLQDRLRSIGGVKSVGTTTTLALKGYRWTSDFTIEGRSPDDFGREVRHKEISADYFETMGIPLVKGRFFNASDREGAAPVVIINSALARQYFAQSEPVGARVKFERPWEDGMWRTIVGVIRDEKQDSLRAEPKPEFYQPVLQNAQSNMAVVVRTEGDPAAMVGAIRNEVRTLDAGLATYDIQTGESLVEQSLERDRFAMVLLAVFAGIAMLLAAVGIYGVMSYAVSQRTHEMGVRVALGARSRDVAALILGGGLKLAVAGVALGLVAAYGVTRLIGSLLFNVSATDPSTFVLVAGVLIAVTLAACYVPARRSSRVDPMVALKYE